MWFFLTALFLTHFFFFNFFDVFLYPLFFTPIFFNPTFLSTFFDGFFLPLKSSKYFVYKQLLFKVTLTIIIIIIIFFFNFFMGFFFFSTALFFQLFVFFPLFFSDHFFSHIVNFDRRCRYDIMFLFFLFQRPLLFPVFSTKIFEGPDIIIVPCLDDLNFQDESLRLK